ncbi:EAL domain-containing protein [Guyparkeria hydrothermalis]|uniref:EAL domain-containing protein n=1 Tax=Guyparkeria hydrothermalis TaxID=923 RepID=UPI0020208B5E|nr:EAL domain-containing protein [Guyparkeria hydrothermalis]MCL7743769.1 EAL domain-containing protein [Guyparkeria hydrothermalis]
MRLLPLPLQFLIFILVQLALSAGLVFYLGNLAESNVETFAEASSGFVDTHKSIEQIRSDYASVAANVERTVASFTPGGRHDVTELRGELKQIASTVRNSVTLGPLRDNHPGAVNNLAAAIESQANALVEASQNLPSADRAEVSRIQGQLADQRARIMSSGFGELIEAANDELESTMRAIRGANAAVVGNYQLVLVAFVALQALLLMVVLWLTNRQIRQLADITERIVAGRQASAGSQQKRRDQLGRIARSVQQFRSSLVSLSNSREQLQAMLKKHDKESLSRRRAEGSLRLTASVFDEVQEAVLVTDIEGHVTRSNPAAEKLLGLTAVQLSERPLLEILLHQPGHVIAPIWKHVLEEGEWRSEIEFTRPDDDKPLIALVSIRLVGEPREGRGHVIVVINDHTEIRSREREILALARLDRVTDRLNRGYFVQQVDTQIRTHPDQPFALVAIGLDGFTAFNEALGRRFGDRILRVIGDRLAEMTAPRAQLARVDGDEFAFLVFAEEEEALDETVEAAMREAHSVTTRRVELAGYRLDIRASVSSAHYPAEGKTSEELLRITDNGLSEAKSQGGNRIIGHAEGHTQAAERRFELTQALGKALGNREMRVHYQPQVSLASGALLGFEALMRWRYRGDWISPSEFIPLAEEHNLIGEFTEWALTHACRRIADWQRQSGQEFTISINMPPQLLLLDKIGERLIQIARAANLPTSSIVLEITESDFGSDPALLAERLHQLAMQGFAIAIDDFGTGHSSLAYLNNLPITKLKIDKQFVDEIVHSEDARKLLGSILAMAEKLEFEVVVEGVETPQQLVELRKFGSRLQIQGFVFSRPFDEDYWDGEFMHGKVPNYPVPDIQPPRQTD